MRGRKRVFVSVSHKLTFESLLKALDLLDILGAAAVLACLHLGTIVNDMDSVCANSPSWSCFKYHIRGERERERE